MRILTVNRGSSSLKFALFEMGPEEALVLKGELERTGVSDGLLRATGVDGSVLIEQKLAWLSTDTPRVVAKWLQSRAEVGEVGGIGHRLVHGGPHFIEPQLVDPSLMTALDGLIPLAPEHLPGEIEAIKTFTQLFPRTPQVACFDTAFHRGMPLVAQTYALPHEEGLIRYGFHGLSYEYIRDELRRLGERSAGNGRVIVAHLGNGCSMAAIRDGVSIDTTMGFTPAGGLVMGTRCGDIDPGVIVYLLRKRGLDPAALSELVNRRSGLLGVSGISPDMRELLACQHDHPQAARAIDLFCYQARKFLGSLAAALGGVDTLVFTGGIGANAPSVRQRICAGLQFLGICLESGQNDANAPIISTSESAVAVRVMTTDEELMLARHTRRVLGPTR